MGGVKDKIMSLFKTNTIKNYRKPTRAKNLYVTGKKPRKLKRKNQSVDNIIKNVKNLFSLKKKMKQSKKEYLYILRTFLNNKKKIITNQ